MKTGLFLLAIVGLLIAGQVSGLFPALSASTIGQGLSDVSLSVSELNAAGGCITFETNKRTICVDSDLVLTVNGDNLRYGKWTNGVRIYSYNGENILLEVLPTMTTQLKSTLRLGEPEPPEVWYEKSTITAGESATAYVELSDDIIGTNNFDYFSVCAGRVSTIIYTPSGTKNVRDSTYSRKLPLKYSRTGKPYPGIWILKGVITWDCFSGLGTAYNEKFNYAYLTVKNAPVPDPVLSSVTVQPTTLGDSGLKGVIVSAKVENSEDVRAVLFAADKNYVMSLSTSGTRWGAWIPYEDFKIGTQKIDVIAGNTGADGNNQWDRVTVYLTVVERATTTTTTKTTTTTVRGTTTTTRVGETTTTTSATTTTTTTQPGTTPTPTGEPKEPCDNYLEDPTCIFEPSGMDKIKNWFNDNQKSLSIFAGAFGSIMAVGGYIMRKMK